MSENAMSDTAINGVVIKRLNPLKDERGVLMEILRCDDPLFKKFGQAYITTCNPGYVKAWHYHKKQTDNLAVISGNARILIYDCRDDSSTKGISVEIFAGKKNMLLVSIPPGVLHGFENLEDEPCSIINFPTEPYNRGSPDELRIDPFKNDIPIKWKNKKGY